MYKKILNFIILILTLFTLTGCVIENNNNGKDNITITDVSLDQNSIPLEIDVDEFDLTNIEVIITKSNGNVEKIALNSSMISETDLNSLKSSGKKEIEILYEGYKLYFSITLTKKENIDSYPPLVNILAINDTHGALYTDGDNVGFEKVNSVIKSLTQENSKFIKIANGDIFQGSYISNIYRGLPMIEVLNIMEFNAFVIGNHEFDWGIEEIAKYADGNVENGEADFPFLASNIIDSKTKKTLPWTKDYVIVEQNGYKVGIIGAIGQYLESSIASDKIKGYSFIDPLPIIKKHSAELRNNLHCDAVIVAIHEYSQDTNNQIAALSGDSRIDAIICGHTHQQINETIKRNDGYYIPIIQSGTKNYSVGTITLNFDDNRKVYHSDINHYIPNQYQADQEILSFIANYQNDINAGDRVLTYTPEYLSRNRIGKEITKAMKEQYNADVAIINTGGVRGDINVGNITVRQIFDVFPFDNYIITTTMRGTDLSSLYDNHGEYLYFNSDFNPYSIDWNKTYTVVTIDFVFTSSYYTHQFAYSVGNYTTLLMRDLFMDYLEN